MGFLGGKYPHPQPALKLAPKSPRGKKGNPRFGPKFPGPLGRAPAKGGAKFGPPGNPIGKEPRPEILPNGRPSQRGAVPEIKFLPGRNWGPLPRNPPGGTGTPPREWEAPSPNSFPRKINPPGGTPLGPPRGTPGRPPPNRNPPGWGHK